MSENQALRASILHETDVIGSRRRFGLFSAPVSIAIGDDGQYKTKLHPRDQTGKPQTQPRGVFTNPPRSGQLNKSNFSGINSLAAGQVKDEYIDPDRKLLQIELETFKKGFKKQQQFKPASNMKILHKSAYEFKQENNPEKDPKRNREPDGKVKAQPRNIYTNQQTTVIKSFFKPIKYMEDPYERAHQTETERAKKQKQMEGEASFKLNLHPKATFSKEKQTFGTDVQFPQKIIKEPNFNIFKHQAKFRPNSPNKHGLYGYFTRFPLYMENPPKSAGRRPKVQKTKDQFRRMSVGLSSKPSPSIAYHPQNLSRTISHSMSSRR